MTGQVFPSHRIPQFMGVFLARSTWVSLSTFQGMVMYAFCWGQLHPGTTRSILVQKPFSGSKLCRRCPPDSENCIPLVSHIRLLLLRYEWKRYVLVIPASQILSKMKGLALDTEAELEHQDAALDGITVAVDRATLNVDKHNRRMRKLM